MRGKRLHPCSFLNTPLVLGAWSLPPSLYRQVIVPLPPPSFVLGRLVDNKILPPRVNFFSLLGGCGSLFSTDEYIWASSSRPPNLAGKNVLILEVNCICYNFLMQGYHNIPKYSITCKRVNLIARLEYIFVLFDLGDNFCNVFHFNVVPFFKYF